MELSQVRALVTGGASGMGRTFARSLARDGAAVAFCDLDAAAVEAVEAEARAEGLELRGFVADVADEAQVVRLVDEAWAALGGLNLWINNAGLFRDGLLVRKGRDGEVHRLSLADWQRVIDVDLTGPFLCTREFAAKRIEAGGGPALVVNMASISRHGNQGQSNYSAAKAGLVADTRLWAQELARYGVRVVAIAPGFVNTPILAGMREDVLQAAVKRVPLGRVGEPEEIYRAVRFAVECDYLTGTCLDVDGGLRL
ncbi:MAG: SDR family oxidoreductase [Deltaproteobacteria bacterium]|nr:SDR family oxidoreductase [Deltaproteobacteria bacterium]